MKRFLLLLSIVFISVSSIAQNTASLPYWPLLLKQNSIAGNDSVLVFNHVTLKYKKMSWSDLNLLTISISDSLYIRQDGTSPATTGPISIGDSQGLESNNGSGFAEIKMNGSNGVFLGSSTGIEMYSDLGEYEFHASGGQSAKLNFEKLTTDRDIYFRDKSDTVAWLSDIVAIDTTGLMRKSGGTFTGPINGVTPTQLTYLNSLTGNVQTQLNGKQSTFGSQSANTVYRAGDAGGVPAFSALSLSDIPEVIRDPIVGVKYTDNFTRASLGPNYTQSGADATFSIVSNKLNVTGGAIPSDFSNRIDYTPYATLPYKNEIQFTYTIGSVNTGGFAFGFKSGLQLWLDTRTSSASVLTLYRNGVLVSYNSLSNPSVLNCQSGDNITIKFVFDKYVLTATAYNDRLKSSIAIQYDWTYFLAGGISTNPPTYISIYAMGGSHTASLITATDNSPKLKSLIGIGNSIMFGYGPYSARRSYYDRFERTFSNVTRFASPGINAADYCTAAMLAEITSQAANCPYAFIMCATNGLAGGSSAATEIGYVNQLIAALVAGNPSIVVYVGTELPRAAIQSTIDSYNALVKSTYPNVIDFASVVTNENLSDGIHPSESGSQNMYALMLNTFRDKIKLISDLNESQSIYSTGVDYRLNLNSAQTLSANITNTDITIPVTTVSGMPPFGYASISDGTSSEIIYYGGISGTNLTNVVRARFATTAITVAATPTNFKVKYVTSLASSEANIAPKKIEYDNFIGYNTTSGLVAQDVYHYRMVSQTNAVYRISAGAGANVAIGKDASSGSSALYFTTGAAYSFRILHDNQNFLQIGNFSNSVGISINSAMTGFGIKTKDYTYRLTNAGSNANATLMIDLAGDPTLSDNWGFDATNGFVYSKGNGTRRIAITGINPVGVNVGTPGSEFGDLGFYTKSSTSGLALRATVNSTGISTIHLQGSSSTPTISAGAGAGTTPTVSVTGTDMGGYITITTGTLPTLSAIVATITFNVAYTSAPRCIQLTPAGANAAMLSGVNMVYVDQSGITTTTFALTAGTTALTAATTYKWYYSVIQ